MPKPRRSSKKDMIISVRLPHSLTIQLKELQKKNFFMDISDEIRFIIRKYCVDRPEQADSDTGIVEQLKKEKLISDLDKILDNLKKGDNAERDRK